MEFSGGVSYGVSSDMTGNMMEFDGSSMYTVPGYGMYSTGSDAEYQQIQSVSVDGGDRYGVSTVAFDPHEELLWMGNQGGHVTSYYSSRLQKYTSFQVHRDQEIRQIGALDSGMLCLSATQLRGQIRRGLPKFTHRSANLVDMQCMLTRSGDTSVLLAGHQSSMVCYDMNRGMETQVVDVGVGGCCLLRHHARYVCCGDTAGRVTLREPGSLRVLHTLEAHSASINDLDVHNNLLITCGFSHRGGEPAVDRHLMVYDLRVLRAISTAPVAIDPYLLKFIPTLSSRLAVVSSLGQLQIVETAQLTQPTLSLYTIETNGSMVSSMDISSNSQTLAVGDVDGCLHLLALNNQQHCQFNSFSRETEFADPIDPLPAISYTDQHACLASIPVPLTSPSSTTTSTTPMSQWWSQYCRPVYRRPVRVDPAILKTMKLVGSIGYAPNPGGRRPNQLPYKPERSGLHHQRGSSSHQSSPSGTIINGICNTSGSGVTSKGPGSGGVTAVGTATACTSGAGSGDGTDGDPYAVHVPPRYRKLDVKYGRCGPDESEHLQYNRTSFSGLECSLPNSYCNPMLQVLFFCEPIRAALLSHLCDREFCLSCELSFLFHMLDTSGGVPCQASNFLRAFRTIPEATALGLILSDNLTNRQKINLPRLIQNWNRFILQQLDSELSPRETLQLPPPTKLPPSISSTTEFPELGTVAVSSPAVGDTAVLPVRFSDAVSADSSVQAAAAMVADISLSGADGAASSPAAGSVSAETAAVGQDGGVPLHPCTSALGRLLGAHSRQTTRCVRCGRQSEKDSALLLCNLSYPQEYSASVPVEFGTVLSDSLCLEQSVQAWCESCSKYQPTEQRRRLISLPHLLAINCCCDNDKDLGFWRVQQQLLMSASAADRMDSASVTDRTENVSVVPSAPPSVKPCRYGAACTRVDCHFWHEGRNNSGAGNISAASQKLAVTGEDGSKTAATVSGSTRNNGIVSWLPEAISCCLQSDGTVAIKRCGRSSDTADEESGALRYELMAAVCHISDPKYPDRNNLTAAVRVGPEYHRRAVGSPVTQWYLFNDLAVVPVMTEESIWMPLQWKVPVIVYYQCCGPAAPSLLTPVRVPLHSGLLSAAQNMAARPAAAGNFTSLQPDEMPAKGDLVAMDAEFVTLNQEEAEIRSDGTKSMLKPSHMSLARLSCVRGQGALEGVAFIDDYISTQEQVVDYLTKFSGIKPGDLDVNFTSKHLTTLKSSYLKLRFLVEVGVKFVGHGLKNDFRVINLVVPSDQVIDTVHLFHLPQQRMVSLRFLAWHFLKLSIQCETHDSVEDARTALALYRKYQSLQAEGPTALTEALHHLYETGRQCGWKLPVE